MATTERAKPGNEIEIKTITPQPSVIHALTAVMADVQAVGKGQRNREQNYNFRGVDAVVNAVGPALRRHGVIVLPILEEANHRDVLTSKDKKSRESTVRVRYRFYGPGGDFIDAVVPGESMDVSDKGVAKAMSVAYRIVLLQALCIPTDEPDADSTYHERANGPVVIVPTEQQLIRFDELAKEIAGAESDDRLKECWTWLVEAYKADEITTEQANELRAAVHERKAEMDERPSDGDGSGPKPGPASPGPGPDSPSAGDGGPGLHGETGGGGSGVQPRVHGRNRIDRGTQAHSGDRDTPAAVGSGRSGDGSETPS